MLTPLADLLGAPAIVTGWYVIAWWRGVTAPTPEAAATSAATERGGPTPAPLAIGTVTNFFDTLGIGSFAPTTAAFKFFKMVPDRLIPGTLNVGHTLAAITQTFIVTLVIADRAERFSRGRLGSSAIGHKALAVGVHVVIAAQAAKKIRRHIEEDDGLTRHESPGGVHGHGHQLAVRRHIENLLPVRRPYGLGPATD